MYNFLRAETSEKKTESFFQKEKTLQKFAHPLQGREKSFLPCICETKQKACPFVSLLILENGFERLWFRSRSTLVSRFKIKELWKDFETLRQFWWSQYQRNRLGINSYTLFLLILVNPNSIYVDFM